LQGNLKDQRDVSIKTLLQVFSLLKTLDSARIVALSRQADPINWPCRKTHHSLTAPSIARHWCIVMPGFRRQVCADSSIPALRLARRRRRCVAPWRRRAAGKLARHRNEKATALY
jgi:hypothetical protein